MTLIHTALMIPAATVLVAASVSQDRQSAINSKARATFVQQRKERIERMLLALDRIAAATQQMKPETAARIEPVVADLAEQTIDLASQRALDSKSTDDQLTKLEATTSELMRTMRRIVEPEADL